MTYRRLALLVSLVCVSCKEPARPAARPAAGPQVRATVVTVRTTNPPDPAARTHMLVIAGDRARSTAERDVWRIFDAKAKTVTFVDDVERTVRTEPLAKLIALRRAANTAALPPYYPRVRLERTDEKKTVAGAAAQQHVVRSGEYRRELWLAEHPAIPAGLFAMMHASDAPSSPLAPMMRAADEALMTARGFPLIDRTEVPLGEGRLIVDRTVISVAERNVPEAMLTVPKGYKDVTPKPAEAGKKKR